MKNELALKDDLESTSRDPELSFENMLGRLDNITSSLEKGNLKLEEALTLFEEGVQLAKVATQKLDAAEKKIELLRNDQTIEPLETPNN